MQGRPIRYKAGAATVCITPDEPLWLAGYAARTEPARGKISDLYASALALEDEDGQRFVIASMDLIAITPAIATSVVAAARMRHGLSREQLLLTATHTHYGPEFRPDKQVFFNIPDEYGAKLPAVAERLAAALTHVIDLGARAARAGAIVRPHNLSRFCSQPPPSRCREPSGKLSASARRTYCGRRRRS